jgi:hypothetical protein
MDPSEVDPASLSMEAALVEFVNEAVRNGWITVGSDATPVPSALAEVLPGHTGIGFTEEGQRRLDELLARLRPGGLTDRGQEQ